VTEQNSQKPKTTCYESKLFCRKERKQRRPQWAGLDPLRQNEPARCRPRVKKPTTFYRVPPSAAAVYSTLCFLRGFRGLSPAPPPPPRPDEPGLPPSVRICPPLAPGGAGGEPPGLGLTGLFSSLLLYSLFVRNPSIQSNQIRNLCAPLFA
jgi:hypothetical protein